MPSKEKNQERTVVMPPSHTETDVFTVTALRKALEQVSISAHQKELILEQLIIPPPPAAAAPASVASVVAVPSAVAVATTSGTTTAAVNNDIDTTHGSDDLMDDEVDALAYGDDDDDDDDSCYDGNVQYPYHPQSKIQYDSDEDSVEDYEFSQQVNYN
tara:strand:- start:33 stop:506 length:474 start_codon:yes stop_codon:yes gene_type:complete